jgi:hypothetical protein
MPHTIVERVPYLSMDGNLVMLTAADLVEAAATDGADLDLSALDLGDGELAAPPPNLDMSVDDDGLDGFDGLDAPALTVEALVTNTHGEIPCLRMTSPLHHSVVLRNSRTNALKLWRAIDDDVEVPEVQQQEAGSGLVAWRWDLQPNFMTLDAAQYSFMQALAAGDSIQEAGDRFADTEVLPSPEVLGAWLQSWLTQGLLRA